ncbi:MAG: GDP-mannose 4,6-dehydratase [Pontimonas sp.]
MRVFITGADGYIGSHVTESLLGKGHTVLALAQYNSFGTAGWLDSVPSSEELDVEMGDIRDAGLIARLAANVDVVIHLAALITIPYSYVAPRSYLETNVLGTHNILEAVRSNRIRRMIHISTSEVYGTAQTVPIAESHPLVGQSPYAASKIAADQLAYSYWASFETPVVTVRPFNTYGPRQSNRAVIPSILNQLLDHPEHLQLGALETTRDLTYVEDTVEGIISAALGTGGEGEVFNLGTGDEWSVRDIVSAISSILGVVPEIHEDPSRMRPTKSEVLRLVSDNSRVREKFGWTPRFTGSEGLERGLGLTVEWFGRNLDSYANRSRLLL